MTAVLGDFLRPARAHITAAARSGGALPLPAKRGVIAELNSLVATMSRCLDDLALPDEFTPASTANPQVRAGLDARFALRRAARILSEAAAAVVEAAADDAHPAVRHLSSAHGYLAAGRDLLQTHFTAGPAGQPFGNTWWASVITSRPVTTALLAELAACSRQLAGWTAQLSRAGSLYAGLPAGASRGLRTASRWLRIAGTSVRASGLQQPSPAGRLLAAIPPGIPPPRQPPGGTETAPELCAGITVTAERLRHAARAFAGQARWSPAANSVSWRRGALASAITGHASELIVRGLADRAWQLGAGSAVETQLAEAANAVSLTWPVWRAIAHHWDTISTGIHHGQEISPVAAELDDLVLRTGRLAYANPRWTPVCADASPACGPADLAPTVSDLRVVLAAVHHAIDAASRVAACDTDTVRDAAAANRLYLPTRLLPEQYDIPCLYAPLPPQLAAELLGVYATAAEASLRAAIALDGLAVATDAASSTLAVARVSSGSPVTARGPADVDAKRTQAQPAPPSTVARPQTGQIENIMRSLDITEPAMLLRAAAIDDAARDVLAHASASSRKRDSINQQPPQRQPRTPGEAAKTAAKETIPGGADARQHVIPAGPVSGLPAGRAPQGAPRKSPGHSSVT